MAVIHLPDTDFGVLWRAQGRLEGAFTLVIGGSDGVSPQTKRDVVFQRIEQLGRFVRPASIWTVLQMFVFCSVLFSPL